jgi:hypothetical protein
MIRLIVWVIVGLLALSFFGISLESLYSSQTNQENISFIGQLLKQGWNQIADLLNVFVSWVQSVFGNHGNA